MRIGPHFRIFRIYAEIRAYLCKYIVLVQFGAPAWPAPVEVWGHGFQGITGVAILTQVLRGPTLSLLKFAFAMIFKRLGKSQCANSSVVVVLIEVVTTLHED